jgi:hypothetical protein
METLDQEMDRKCMEASLRSLQRENLRLCDRIAALEDENADLRLRALPADQYKVFPDHGPLEQQMTWLRENRNMWMQRCDELRVEVERLAVPADLAHRIATRIEFGADLPRKLRHELQDLKATTDTEEQG